MPSALRLTKGLGLLPEKQKRIIRRTFRVGKSKKVPKVSVLLNSKHLRNQILNRTKKIQRIPLSQIKQKLVQAGMVRIGTVAPESVLREIYTNMFLIGGPIQNIGQEILLFNLLNGGI